MSNPTMRRGRPNKFAHFERLAASSPKEMRRPKYLDRIGVRRGPKGDTIWVKIQLPNGATWKGRAFPPNHALEVKLGRLSSVTWAEAITRRDELQGRADRGQPLEDRPIPRFKEWAEDWFGRKRPILKRPDTPQGHLSGHLIPEFGIMPLDQITPARIERWIAKAREAGYAAGYIKRMLNTFKAILNDAIREGHIAENPARSVSRIKGVATRTRFLEAAEIVRLLVAAEEAEPWMYDAIVWALHSGMRRGEIQRLHWSDLREIGDGKTVVLLETTKSGKPRVITCTSGMREVLDRQAERRVDGDDRVFPVSPMIWRRRWEKARASAELQGVTFHDLRRTNATQAAVAGVDLRTLAARIGHADLSMLEKHYAMVVGSAEHEAAERIQATFDDLTANVVSLKQG